MFSIKQPKEIVFGKNSAHMYKYPENSLIITSPGAKKRNWMEYFHFAVAIDPSFLSNLNLKYITHSLYKNP